MRIHAVEYVPDIRLWDSYSWLVNEDWNTEMMQCLLYTVFTEVIYRYLCSSFFTVLGRPHVAKAAILYPRY